MDKKKFNNLRLPMLDQPMIQAPEGETPKTKGGLAPGHLIGSNVNHEYTVVFCSKCESPLWRVYPIVDLSEKSTYQKPAEPIGHKKKMPKGMKDIKGFKCSVCGLPFAIYADKTNSIKYLTSKGIV